ncbi:CrcB family protein [Microbacterium sp. G2-8]|uniref:fluoride efflux transporter FluC n=1 Tax=Microbacterium sp. G2-8 TaxID=2842454 RepID=UPI001C89CC9F|nr:CrcB family protein [Microbacterium sp. G2-8]
MTSVPRPAIDWGQLPLVIAGGAAGVLLRYLLTGATGAGASGVFLPILAINIVGSFLLGVVVGALGDRAPRRRAFLGTGVLGGFTSYSALAPAFGYAGLFAVGPALGAMLMYAGIMLAVVAGSVAGALAGLAIGGSASKRRRS